MLTRVDRFVLLTVRIHSLVLIRSYLRPNSWTHPKLRRLHPQLIQRVQCFKFSADVD